MFESALAPVITLLEQSFGTVYDLFSEINMPEHKNETLCFSGIDGYTLSDTSYAGSSGSYRNAEVKYTVQLLGKRNMSAHDLCEILDTKVLPALEGCAEEIKDILRQPCRYVKEQGRYLASAELTFYTKQPSETSPKSVPFSLGGTSFNCFTKFEIENSVKTAETALLNGVIKSRKIGLHPAKITLSGKAFDGGANIYTQLKPSLGLKAGSLTVNGMDFSGYMMSGLKLTVSKDGAFDISTEFTEVDEA